MAGKVAVVSRSPAESGRLAPIIRALAAEGLDVAPVQYSDAVASEVRDQLCRVDGVLVWVDPIAGEEDRTQLDAVLREVAAGGVFVSAHPDVILKMGTKEVLYRTRELGWGSDVHLYASISDFRQQFPERLAAAGPRVLKQHRGNGGIGVWKVDLAGRSLTDAPRPTASPDAKVWVQHAQIRDTTTEEMTLAALMQRMEAYFASDGTGCLIDQAFQPRIANGLIRCYLVQHEVIGFARQYPEGRSSAEAASSESERVFGLPSAKTMYGPDEPAFGPLKSVMESEWVPAMQRLLDVSTASLPILWDADFLFGPEASGGDTYVLCEINVSCVIPFPDQAPARVAGAALAALRQSG